MHQYSSVARQAQPGVSVKSVGCSSSVGHSDHSEKGPHGPTTIDNPTAIQRILWFQPSAIDINRDRSHVHPISMMAIASLFAAHVLTVSQMFVSPYMMFKDRGFPNFLRMSIQWMQKQDVSCFWYTFDFLAD